jgi:hypothetical protein
MVASSTSGTTAKLDIIKFAKDIMSEVDSIRSYLPSFNDEMQQTDQRPTESRVNAFFRLVGLPMFVSVSKDNDKEKSGGGDSAQKIVTPGYEQGGFIEGIIVNSKETKLTGPDGKEVSAQVLLQTREQKLLEREQKIGTTQMNTRMATAFYDPLSLTLNENGKDANGSELFKRVSPFAVSYSQIFPAQNELSKPFLTDPEQGRPPPSSTSIRRPFIETVVRIRMVSLDGGNQKQEDYLKSTRDRIAQLSSQASNMLPQEASLYEAFIIDQMLGALDQFADRWVMLQNRRERLSKEVTIVLKPKTSSSQRSAFGKQGNMAIELKLEDNSTTGQRLAALNRGIAVSEAMIGLLPTEDTTSLTGSTVRNVMPNALTNAFVSVLRQPIEQQKKKLEELNKQLEALAQQADRLRLELEMMTGEFTGLSLPDMVFTILGLFLIDREDLIALLDSATLNHMSQDKILKTVVDEYVGYPTITAISNLENKVTDLYSTLETAIELRLNRNKRTAKNSIPLASSPDQRYQDILKLSQTIFKVFEASETEET